MRHIWFVVLIAIVGLPAYAQTPLRGSGQLSGVVQSETGQPLVSAQVVLRNAADSTAVRGAVSGSDGRFLIDGIQPGNYNLRITFVGYKPHDVLRIVLTNEQPRVELGTLKLAVAPIALTQVEATAAKAPVVMEADRTIHDTRDMIAAKGGKAVDVLRGIPELEVDVNGNVSMRGNQTVAIQFNGKTAPLKGDALTNYLQQMPGERIAKVEVIPNPGAKYDPEGAGGIVNIVLKENSDLGLSGNVSLNGSTRLTRGGGMRINYQKGRLTFFTGGNISINNSTNRLDDLRRNLLATPITLFHQNSTSKNFSRFGYVDLNTELKVGKQATVWLNGSTYGSSNHLSTLTANEILTDDMALLDNFDRSNRSTNAYLGATVSMGFKQVFVPNKHELSFDLSRDASGNDYEGRVRQLLADPSAPVQLTHNDSDYHTDENAFTIDYTRALRAGKLEAGTRFSARHTDFDITANMLADEQVDGATSTTRNNYEYRERFNSAYVTLNRPVNKFSLMAGLRGEIATTDFQLPVSGDAFDNRYNTLFPSAAVSYDFGGGKTLRVNYSKRIGRPAPDVLNPYSIVIDPLNRQVGNPNLRPNYTHSASAELSRVAAFGTLRLATYYRRTTDQWTNIKHVDTLGVSTVTWVNLADMETYGATATASLKPVRGVSGSLTVNSYRELRDAGNLTQDYVRSAYRWSLNANSTIKLNESTNAQMNANYRPAQILVQGHISGMLITSLGVRRQLMDKKASLNLFVTDPFALFRYDFVTNDRTHEQLSHTRPNIRQASLTFTYNWGKPPEQQAKRPNQDNSSTSETVQIR